MQGARRVLSGKKCEILESGDTEFLWQRHTQRKITISSETSKAAL